MRSAGDIQTGCLTASGLNWLGVCLFEPWDKVSTTTNMGEVPCFAATSPQPQSVQPTLVQSRNAEASRRIWSGLVWWSAGSLPQISFPEMIAKGPAKARPEVCLCSQGKVKAMGTVPRLPAVAAALMG